MLAEKNENIKIAYEARQAEIMDQLTREKSASDKRALEIAKNLIDVLDINTIAEKTGLSIDVVRGLKN